MDKSEKIRKCLKYANFHHKPIEVSMLSAYRSPPLRPNSSELIVPYTLCPSERLCSGTGAGAAISFLLLLLLDLLLPLPPTVPRSGRTPAGRPEPLTVPRSGRCDPLAPLSRLRRLFCRCICFRRAAVAAEGVASDLSVATFLAAAGFAPLTEEVPLSLSAYAPEATDDDDPEEASLDPEDRFFRLSCDNPLLSTALIVSLSIISPSWCC